jgi:hypothetical protein
LLLIGVCLLGRNVGRGNLRLVGWLLRVGWSSVVLLLGVISRIILRLLLRRVLLGWVSARIVLWLLGISLSKVLWCLSILVVNVSHLAS